MANSPWATAEDRFGRNLRRARELSGLSQAELAKRLEGYGVSLHPSAIAKIEARDAANPRAIRLNEADALAKALGYAVTEIAEPTEGEAPPAREHHSGTGTITLSGTVAATSSTSGAMAVEPGTAGKLRDAESALRRALRILQELHSDPGGDDVERREVP